MRVFSSSDMTHSTISYEQFAAYYRGASVVSMESIGQYLQRTRDIFESIKGTVTSDQDKFVQETLNNKHEVLYLARNVNYNDFRRDLVTRPEGLSSLFVDYLEDLANIAHRTHESAMKSLDTLKLSVAAFINEHQEGQIDSLYGSRYFDAEKKVIDTQREINKKHFRASANKTTAEVQDIIKSMSDFSKIYPLIDTCAAALNKPNADALEKLSRDAIDLIDALVDQNLKTGVLVKSQGAKKELVEAIDQTARAVEFYTALYAEFFGLCSSFKKLTEALIARS